MNNQNNSVEDNIYHIKMDGCFPPVHMYVVF